MKVIAINGSPHSEGNTYYALKAVTDELEKEGIETEIVNVGGMNITGCKACGACSKIGACIINDGVNEAALKMTEADGIIIGSPVYYADINGTLKAFLDRAFYAYGSQFRFKPAAAVVAARRGGAVHAYDTINHYFGITEMLVTPSTYWNAVHGAAAGECLEDKEGIQMMQTVGRNMAYLLKLRKASNLIPPDKEPKIKFNYIR